MKSICRLLYSRFRHLFPLSFIITWLFTTGVEPATFRDLVPVRKGGGLYSVVQNNSSMFEFPAFIPQPNCHNGTSPTKLSKGFFFSMLYGDTTPYQQARYQKYQNCWEHLRILRTLPDYAPCVVRGSKYQRTPNSLS